MTDSNPALCFADVAAVAVLARPKPPYSQRRVWGDFDALGVRSIDDLSFSQQGSSDVRRLVLFTMDLPRASGIEAVGVPVQIALERAFFHIQGILEVILNPRTEASGLAHAQISLDYSLPVDAPAESRLSREQIADVIGALQSGEVAARDRLLKAEKAFKANSLFEAYSCARAARIADEGNTKAWFIETLAASYLGLPEEALDLYEKHPKRGSSEPDMQLLSARFRLLLRQFNEARTILHTLTFQSEVSELAGVELARSFLMEGEYARALDNSQTTLSSFPNSAEARLIRGLAQRSLAYPSGEEAGLLEALGDFQSVAKSGGVNAPEALFHAGVVLARLGRLHESEIALRQSLFQRDRYASRDALIRVLVARGDKRAARDEYEVIKELKPVAVSELSSVITSLEAEGEAPAHSDKGPLERLAQGGEGALAAAEQLLQEWRFPVVGDASDFAALDEFLDYYAPSGAFSPALEFAFLNEVGTDVVARAISLHFAKILAAMGDVEVTTVPRVVLGLKSAGGRIPIESFVRDRIVVGASRDNFSSLESLLVELPLREGALPNARAVVAWTAADESFLKQIQDEVSWVREVLSAHSVQLDESLHALEVLDTCIDEIFEAEGGLKEGVLALESTHVPRFIAGCGFLVGTIIDKHVPSAWCQHAEANGVSIVSTDLGRIFPVARLYRRVSLAGGADYGSRLASLAIGVGAACALAKAKAGELRSAAEVERFLLEQVPGVSHFSSQELEALIKAIVSS